MIDNTFEKVLTIKNLKLDKKIKDDIEAKRKEAISNNNEEAANYYWCLRQIYLIQSHYLSAFYNMKEKKFADAWLLLDQADIELGSLEENFDIYNGSDSFHLVFIGETIKKYQRLFPYKYFLSRENIIKSEKCSICDQKISLRHPCGHKVGKLYMGELCVRIITECQFVAMSIVTDPFDKYTYLQVEDKEYNYSMVEKLMSEIDTPYDNFDIECKKVLKPEYSKKTRNEKCPCGSGKKYKKCHLGTDDELMDHYMITLHNKVKPRTKMDVFNTWK